MSIISTIFAWVMLIIFGLAFFNIFANFVGSLLGMTSGILGLITLLPWILLEKITGIEPPSWVMRLVDAVGWINPAKWIK